MAVTTLKYSVLKLYLDTTVKNLQILEVLKSKLFFSEMIGPNRLKNGKNYQTISDNFLTKEK